MRIDNPAPNTYTIDHVEYVTKADIQVGDIIFSFTPIGQSIDIPPTQRQLNAKRTRWSVVTSIEFSQKVVDGNTVILVEVNRDQEDWSFGASYAGMWRLKRR